MERHGALVFSDLHRVYGVSSGSTRLHAPDAWAAQVDIHAPWGGVVPKLAQEAHERAMDSTVEAALQEAGISLEQLAGVAVTIGPGLSLCLRVIPLPGPLSTLEVV